MVAKVTTMRVMTLVKITAGMMAVAVFRITNLECSKEDVSVPCAKKKRKAVDRMDPANTIRQNFNINLN